MCHYYGLHCPPQSLPCIDRNFPEKIAEHVKEQLLEEKQWQEGIARRNRVSDAVLVAVNEAP